MTVQLLKEQNKYDEMPSVLLNRLQRILPLGRKVADDIVCEETEILEKVIQRMFEVMRNVAEFSFDYVKGSRQSSSVFASTDDQQRDRLVGLPTQRRSKKWTKR